MYKIASFSPSKGSNIIESIEEKNYLDIDIVDIKNFNEINMYDGIVIYENDKNDIFSICEVIIQLKQIKNFYLWVISKEARYTERLMYLQLGVDVVLDSSYDIVQLKWIIKNSLSRCTLDSQHQEQVLKVENKKDEFSLLPSNLSVVVNGKTEIYLTKIEFRTIEFLLSNANRTCTYDDISTYVWGGKGGKDRMNVSNIIFQLRNKMKKNCGKERWLSTIRSIGYRLNCDS